MPKYATINITLFDAVCVFTPHTPCIRFHSSMPSRLLLHHHFANNRVFSIRLPTPLYAPDECILARLEKNWAGRTDSQRSSAWIDRQMDKVDACLNSISMALAERPFFVGNHLSLADIAVGCALAYLDFRFPDISWRTRYENLGPYLEKLLLRPSFIDTNFTS